MNTGFLQSETVDINRWRFGGISGVDDVFILPENKKWTDYMPTPFRELQYGKYLGSTQDCVTRSMLNSLEILCKAKFNWDIDFSDRWIAKLSGTTRNGNYLEKVADTAREYGLIEEKLWTINLDDKITFEKYYEEPPVDLLSEGKKFLETFELQNEWVNPNPFELKQALKNGPVQIVWEYRGSYMADPDGVIRWKKDWVKTSNHSSVLLDVTDHFLVYDTFDDVIKKLSLDYYIAAAMRHNIKKKTNKPIMNIPDKFKKGTHLVQNSQGDGSFALIIDGTMRVGEKADMILTYLARTSGSGIPKELWDSLRKEAKDFKGNPAI